MRVKKAVILAAGLNSRMFPIAKAIPKAMLPLGAKPAILFTVEECAAAGIKDIVIIVNKKNSLVEQFFTKNAAITELLDARKRAKALAGLKKIESLARLAFITQKTPWGEAHALFQARNFLGGRAPFAVLYADTLYDAKPPALQQAVDLFAREKKHAFGSIGRFVFLPTVFRALQKIDFARYYKTNKKGLNFHDFVSGYLHEECAFFKISGKRFDVGSPDSYAEAFNYFRTRE